jgi:hypothetical protein
VIGVPDGDAAGFVVFVEVDLDDGIVDAATAVAVGAGLAPDAREISRGVSRLSRFVSRAKNSLYFLRSHS